MKVLFTICGRAGSKGIRNKNIREFLDKPLPLFTISAIDLFLKNCPEVEADIALNTDSEELISIVENNGMRKVSIVPRKQALAGDTVGKLDVIRDTMLEMEQRAGAYDMVIDMDLTSPLRQDGDLEKVYREQKTGKWDAVFTVADSRRNPYFNMVTYVEGEGYKKVIASDFTARQQAPEIFDMNASIYAYAPEFLRNTKSIFDGKCGIVKMYDTAILDLDHESDFELMELVARYLFDSKPDFTAIYSNMRK